MMLFLLKKKRKLIYYAILSYIILLFIRYYSSPIWTTLASEDSSFVKRNDLLPNVIVHLDLKGSPPKLSYLNRLLPFLRRLGVNGLLMEYEDMFPYSGRFDVLRASNCYNRDELSGFLLSAKGEGISVIPLIQTFGHMEFVLKHKRFAHLRENVEHPDSICPSRNGTRSVIDEMLSQVLSFHNSITPLKYIHIGCDEVYQMNTCGDCVKRNITNIQLFKSHVQGTVRTIQSESPGTTVLIWDDMLRGSSRYLLDIDLEIEPVCWYYHTPLGISHVDIYKYHKNFKNIWVASAFKGADGNTAVLPNINDRYNNHYSWVKLIWEYKQMFKKDPSRTNFKGIILTGWSRYNHFATMCELLPSSIPSLVLNLLVVSTFKSHPNLLGDFSDKYYEKYLQKQVNGELDCYDVEIDKLDGYHCDFEGSKINALLIKFIKATLLGDELLMKKLNVNNVSELKSLKNKTQNLVSKIQNLSQELRIEMMNYFDNYTVNDYINSKTRPVLRKVRQIF